MTVSELVLSKQDCMSEADVLSRIDAMSYSYGLMLKAEGVTQAALNTLPDEEKALAFLAHEVVEISKGVYVLKFDVKKDRIINKFGRK